MGAVGDDVKKLQRRLNALGYLGADGKPLAVDGIFGPNTLHGVNAFKNAKLPGGNTGVNKGVVGRQTWEIMFSAPAAAQSVSPSGAVPTAPSPACIQFIASYEGFSAMPYRGLDSQNRTVGYGHVITAADGTKYDNGITEKDALALLHTDAERFTKQLNNFLSSKGISLTQNQYDALLSFSFNCGGAWMNQSTLRNILISKEFNKVGDALNMWVNVNGKRAQGLVNRRADEVEMFYRGNYKRR